MSKMSKNYDPECHSLAAYFLADYDFKTDVAERLTDTLAEEIQNCVEAWLAELDRQMTKVKDDE